METRKQSSVFDKTFGAVLQVADSFWNNFTEVSSRTHWLLPTVTDISHSPLCPACNRSILLMEETRVGRAVTCAACSLSWEVTARVPLKLASIEPQLFSELVEGDWAD